MVVIQWFHKEQSMYETILLEKADGISIIHLNRPQKKNAISMKMRQELIEVFNKMEQDEEVRVVILTGGEECFCAGVDLKEGEGISNLIKENSIYRITHVRGTIHRVIEQLPKPTIAAVSGLALGGGLEMALACDFRIASDTAKFGFPEIRLGGLPAGGGTQKLTRVVGITKAKEMILTGELIDAEEAYRIGLLNKVVPINRLMEEAKKMGSILGERPPLALTLAKYAINVGSQMDIDSALDYESSLATILYKTEDRQEGIRAFLEKRKPMFRGK
jgi:enoyl-CoA hydratase